MSRKLMAILVSSALVFGTVSTSAWSAPSQSSAIATQTVAPVNNPSPLPAGGAAGIKQAQGFDDSPWFGIAVVVGLFIVGVLLLQDDDDDESVSTTGTAS